MNSHGTVQLVRDCGV